MNDPDAIEKELEKRDELILALEMLTVDQACRLLALESVVTSMADIKSVNVKDVRAKIKEKSKRFKNHFEGKSITGFIERSQRISDELIPRLGKNNKMRKSNRK